MLKSKLVCPKCKSNNLILKEIWNNHSIEFTQDKGLINLSQGNLDPGSPERVDATCTSCQGRWKVHGINQITDL